MNREEAKKALMWGKRLTHPTFTSEEWVEMSSDGHYVTEDGIMHNPRRFWELRADDYFDSDWSLF